MTKQMPGPEAPPSGRHPHLPESRSLWLPLLHPAAPPHAPHNSSGRPIGRASPLPQSKPPLRLGRWHRPWSRRSILCACIWPAGSSCEAFWRMWRGRQPCLRISESEKARSDVSLRRETLGQYDGALTSATSTPASSTPEMSCTVASVLCALRLCGRRRSIPAEMSCGDMDWVAQPRLSGLSMSAARRASLLSAVRAFESAKPTDLSESEKLAGQ